MVSNVLFFRATWKYEELLSENKINVREFSHERRMMAYTNLAFSFSYIVRFVVDVFLSRYFVDHDEFLIFSMHIWWGFVVDLIPVCLVLVFHHKNFVSSILSFQPSDEGQS